MQDILTLYTKNLKERATFKQTSKTDLVADVW